MLMLRRRNPVREMLTFQQTMDRLFQDAFARPGYRSVGVRVPSLAIDVKETEDGYTVTASLPGVKPEETDISVIGNTLTIRGEIKSEDEKDRDGYLVRERRSGSFQRSLTLPVAINADAAGATHENGVLTLTLPKAEAAKPKQIKVATPAVAQIEAGEPVADPSAEAGEPAQPEAKPAN